MEGVWCGLGAGWGNGDVVPCTNTEWSLEERGLQSLSTEMYSVGEIQVMRESFNRTANSARARNISLVTPWVWLGGGARRGFGDSAFFGGGFSSFGEM